MPGFRCSSMSEAEDRYGKVQRLANGMMRWPDEIKWMVLREMPSILGKYALNTKNGKPTTTIYCNKDMAPSLITAFELLHMRKLMPELKSYDGCFAIRDVRGRPGILSAHSYGLAIDLNASLMPLNAVSLWSEAFVNTWKELGFIWGGDFKSRCDAQHFEWIG